MLEAAGIAVERGGRHLLDGVSATLSGGIVTGIIGPNGAGKSTLLRVLAGLQTAGRGSVTLDGQALASFGRRVRARRIAYLPQHGRAEWPVSVAQLVALGRLPHGTEGTRADQEAVARALAALEIADLADRAVTTLSGGEQARALLARALAVEADHLIADEPTLALDPHHQLTLMALLRSTADAGTAVAVSLHDLSLAARFCDRLVLLDHGRVLASGLPDAVLTPALLARAYRVEGVFGRHEATPFVLPWRPTQG